MKRVVAGLAAIYLLWGSTYLAISIVVEALPPFAMAGSRFLAAGLLLYLFARWRGAPKPTILQWRSALAAGALLLLGGNGVVSWAEQSVPSGLAALLISTSTPIMVVVGWLRGYEKPSLVVALGLLVGFSGIAVLVWPSIGGAAMVPTLGLLGAAVSWALGSLLLKDADMPDSAAQSTGMLLAAGGALLLVFASARGEWSHLDLAAVPARAWWALGYLAVFGSLIGACIYTWLLRNAPIRWVVTYAYVNPVVACVLGWAILDEAIGWRTIVAGSMVLVSVMLAASHPQEFKEPIDSVETIQLSDYRPKPTLAVAAGDRSDHESDPYRMPGGGVRRPGRAGGDTAA